MTAVTRPDNPIVWQELTHQRRNAPRLVQRWWVLAPFTVILMIVLVAATLMQVDYPTRELGIYMIWIVHMATATRALAAGANAISREHVGLTWDSLVLTGVSTRQILFGKWLAVMRRVGPSMVMLGLIRLAMIPIWLIALLNYYGWLLTRYNGYGYLTDEPVFAAWVPWAAMLAVVMSVVLTVLEVMACTAIGLAASAVTRRGISAMAFAMLIRFTPVVLMAAFTRYDLGSAATSSYRVLRHAPFAVADSGTAPLSRLSVPYTPLSYTTHADALYGLTMATIVLIVMLVGALLVAWVAIRRSGALPHARYGSSGNAIRAKTGG
jgi:hypothetical protein